MAPLFIFILYIVFYYWLSALQIIKTYILNVLSTH